MAAALKGRGVLALLFGIVLDAPLSGDSGWPEDYSVSHGCAQHAQKSAIVLEDLVEDFKDDGHFARTGQGFVIVNNDDGFDEKQQKNIVLFQGKGNGKRKKAQKPVEDVAKPVVMSSLQDRERKSVSLKNVTKPGTQLNPQDQAKKSHSFKHKQKSVVCHDEGSVVNVFGFMETRGDGESNVTEPYNYLDDIELSAGNEG